jgi:hypothetical protein
MHGLDDVDNLRRTQGNHSAPDDGDDAKDVSADEVIMEDPHEDTANKVMFSARCDVM